MSIYEDTALMKFAADMFVHGFNRHGLSITTWRVTFDRHRRESIVSVLAAFEYMADKEAAFVMRDRCRRLIAVMEDPSFVLPLELEHHEPRMPDEVVWRPFLQLMDMQASVQRLDNSKRTKGGAKWLAVGIVLGAAIVAVTAWVTRLVLAPG